MNTDHHGMLLKVVHAMPWQREDYHGNKASLINAFDEHWGASWNAHERGDHKLAHSHMLTAIEHFKTASNTHASQVFPYGPGPEPHQQTMYTDYMKRHAAGHTYLDTLANHYKQSYVK